MWLTMEKPLGFIMKFSKKLGNLSILSNFYIFYCFFRVILVKRCALVNFQTKSQIWWKIVVLSKNYAILIAKPHFITKLNMLSLQNMIFFSFTINFIKKWNISFYKWEFVGNCCISCKHAISKDYWFW